jgi:hypothetical protein
MNGDPIVPHVAGQRGTKYTLEEVFRSQNILLTNLITTEFSFVLEFFDLKSSQCDYIFNAIFSKIVNYYLEWLDNACNNSFDCVSVLLMVLINDEFKIVMKERKINILDFYFDKVGMVLWPRFTDIFEHFLNNVKNANAATFNLKDVKVNFTPMRYVSLMLMLYKIAYKTGHNMLLSRLTKFQGLMMMFIGRLSEEAFNNKFGDKERRFFRMNNLHVI